MSLFRLVPLTGNVSGEIGEKIVNHQWIGLAIEIVLVDLQIVEIVSIEIVTIVIDLNVDLSYRY